MKQNEFQKIDEKILKQSPFNWIIGWHIFIPTTIGLMLVAILIGFLPPVKIYDYDVPYLNLFTFFLGFLSMIVFIFFIVRQIKYNSFRIHHHLPFSKGILNFFSIWLIAFLLIVVPFLSYETYTFKVKQHVATITDDFDGDIITLNEGLPFFEIQTYRKIVGISFKSDDIIKINDNDSFIYSTRNISNNTINKEEALEKIRNFISVAKKYDINLLDNDANSVFNRRKEASINHADFHLLADPNFRNESVYGGNKELYSRILRNYRRNQKYLFEQSDTIITILVVSLFFSFVLWGFISVEKRDFGFAILFGAILSLLIGFISVVVGFVTSFDELRVFEVHFVSYIVLLIFPFIKRNIKWTKSFMIISNVVFVALGSMIYHGVYTLIAIDNYKVGDNFIYVFVPLVILSVVIYNRIYRNLKILPQNK